MPGPMDAAREIEQDVKAEVGDKRFSHWFKGQTRWTTRGDELMLEVGSPYLVNWFQRQFRAIIMEAAQTHLGPSARLTMAVDATILITNNADAGSAAASEVVSLDQDGQQSAKAAPSSQRTSSSRSRATEHPLSFQRKYSSIREFVVGPCNELAMTAARRVVESPGCELNPLCFYGSTGNGKTHLLEAIYKEIRQRYPHLQLLFMTAENFGNYFTQNLREHSLPSFRQRFRNVDVILVDDVDFFDGKRSFQEEFLHTIKQLETHGKQIIVSLDRHPRLLSKTSDELLTRFVSGLTCLIDRPDFDTRLQIAVRLAKKSKADITSEAVEFVAKRFTNNVREVEGAINSLQTYHTMTGRRVTLKVARDALSKLERDCLRIVRLDDIDLAVCEFFAVESTDLKSARRTRNISQPRMIAMYLARKLTQAAYSEIGAYWGGRNHSTAMAAEKKVLHHFETDSTIRIASQSWSWSDIAETIEQQLLAG